MNALEKIQRAFSRRIRPTMMLIPKQLASHEFDDVKAILGRHWNEISAAELEKNFEFMHWLTPEAFCYYLPAIMCTGIRENNPELILNHSLINFLDRSADAETWDRFFTDRWTQLDSDECEAIQEWVLWLSSCVDTSLSQHALGRAIDVLESLKNRVN